ncbi:MAG: TIGR02996 domain-containing protein [Gemmataceae bacterium]|nr:TIGR02996 domain-containing protein [Gemmataceae bacterium]
MPDLPADQRALLAAVVATPDDDTPRLVYADWLDDHGDPVQAGYIRESVRLARLPANDPGRPGLEKRLTAVLEDNADEWAVALGRAPAATGMCYRRGFVHTIRYHRLDDYLRDGPAWFRTAPVQGLSVDFGEVPPDDPGIDWWAANRNRLRWFAESTDFARLRSLAIHGLNAAEESWIELLKNPALAGLRELDVSGCGWTDEELEWVDNYTHFHGLQVLDLGDVPPDRIPDGIAAFPSGWHFLGLRAVYFGEPLPPTDDGLAPVLDPEWADRMTAHFGDRWGNRRPPPPVWC